MKPDSFSRRHMHAVCVMWGVLTFCLAELASAEVVQLSSLPPLPPSPLQLDITGCRPIEVEAASASDDALGSVSADDIKPAESVVINLDSLSSDEDAIETTSHETVVVIDESKKPDGTSDRFRPPVRFGTWVGYNPTCSSTTWVAGGDFGITSLESFPTLDVDGEDDLDDATLSFGTGFHFLSGPTPSDLPPRLFDFSMAFHARKPISDVTTLDLKLGVGAFSDFESSARKGVRFPGHVVTHTVLSSESALVFGLDILDRDDISLLPVAGFNLRMTDDVFVEAVFPRPKLHVQVSDKSTMYLGAELGGGTWAIERDDRSRDNATYRDIRVTWGLSTISENSESLLEVGWAFDRQLEYRSHVGNVDFDGAFVLRHLTRY